MNEPLREAIVLVGGFGTRLRSLVSGVPKPMALVGGRPFLEWVFDHLLENQTDRIILAAGYLADRLSDHFGGSWNGAELSYSFEPEPLGTGGAVSLAMNHVHGKGVHILNGDTYLRYSMAEMERRASMSRGDLAMALAWVDDVARYGSVELKDGLVSGFNEKGRNGAGFINAGSYYAGPRATSAFPSVRRYSFETAVLQPMVSNAAVAGLTDTQGFIDIGVPDDYIRAQEVFAR